MTLPWVILRLVVQSQTAAWVHDMRTNKQRPLHRYLPAPDVTIRWKPYLAVKKN